MMLRRRAMLCREEDPGYVIEYIPDLELLFTRELTVAEPIYYADSFTFDPATGLFTLTDAKELWINYISYDQTAPLLIGHYVSYVAEPDVEIYYLPPDTGLTAYYINPFYRVYAEGDIHLYLPAE